MGSLSSDLHLSFRQFFKNPGFAAIAITALALGIGANTAIFSVVNTVLLQPLPYPEPDRILRVQRVYQSGDVGASTSIPKFMAWKKNNRTFEALALYDFAGPGLNLGSGSHPQAVKGIHVSAEYFRVFGATPVRGRTFLPQEDSPGGANAVVISTALWQSQLGGDPSEIGKQILLGGQPYTVVGILGPDFRPDPPADVFLPIKADPNSTNQGHYLLTAGRLKPGATIEAANANMKMAGDQFRQSYPLWMGNDESVGVVPLRDALVKNIRPALLILLGAVGFVLLIACANVANLLLARAAGRQKEIAIRTAIGATRWRLVRQLLTESILLGTLGGVFGFLLGAWGVRVLLALSPGDIPRVNDETHAATLVSALDWHVFAFTLALAVATGILFGLIPALRVARLDVISTLKESAGRSGSSLRHNRIRGLLVVAEMALAVVLLAGAALMIRTFAGLRAVKPGFDASNVITLQTSLSGGYFDVTTKVESLIAQIVPRLSALPGVQAVTAAAMLPAEGDIDLTFSIEGRTPPKGTPYTGDEQWRFVTPGYFQVFRIPLLRGRLFDDRDNSRSEHVVLINQAMAKKYWPQGDPVGQRMKIGTGLGPDLEEKTPREIIGIVADAHEGGLSSEIQPVMYVPQGQIDDSLTKLANNVISLSWAIRTASDPAAMAGALQKEFQAVNGQLPISKVRTMRQLIAESTAREDFNVTLLTTFAGIALLLAAIGIYGLMSYTVEQRRQEIGIRMALGAGHGAMVALMVRQGLILAGIGLTIGLGGAFGLTRLLAGLLFSVKANDPLSYTAVAMVLTIVALLASYIPARRATRVDPLHALRYE